MNAKTYGQYFNIDEKYYAVVTKELIDRGEVRWEGYYPHETFVQLLRQVTDMLSGKENKSIWVEGAYGSGKSHAALTVKCLLEASEEAVRAYFEDYGLNQDLCNKFLAARNEQVNGPLVVVHRVGTSDVNNDDDLIWTVQSSIKKALEEKGIEENAEATMKEAFLKWVGEKAANKTYLNSLLAEDSFAFNGMNADGVIETLTSADEDTVQYLMSKLIKLGRENNMSFLKADPTQLGNWIKKVIEKNKLNAIVFIWDEFSEFFSQFRNSLTGFQTLTEVSLSHPFYFMIVTHESDALIKNTAERNKIKDRFMDTARIELPDNTAFRLMAQAMKETADPALREEWYSVKQALNSKLGSVRSRITEGAKRNAKAGEKTILNDEDLQGISPLHPYAALILKHVTSIYTSGPRSMFEFIIARDPEEGEENDKDENVLYSKAFKWFIHNYGPFQQNNLMTVDMLWDFFTIKASTRIHSDALKILNNYDMLTSNFHLDPDQQRVLKTILLMNAICTQVTGMDMLVPTYENIDLAFLGTNWPMGKASNIAKAMVHREAPLLPVLFEEPTSDGKMRVIPKGEGGDDIEVIKQRIRQNMSASGIAQEADLASKLKPADYLEGHFETSFIFANANSTAVFTNSIRDLKAKAQDDPNKFYLAIALALTDEERSEVGKQIETLMRTDFPENLLIVDGSTNAFTPYIENYVTNKAYSEYHLKSDKKMSGQFAAYAAKSIATWAGVVVNGEFRLYDRKNKNGRVKTGFVNLDELLREINHEKYPFGLECYTVNNTLYTRIAIGQGAECGLSETEKGSFASSNPKTKLSSNLTGVWKVDGVYWEDPTKQGLTIVQIKRKAEEIIREGFEKNGRIDIIDILDALREPPFGFVANNLSAFMLGFVLKEYANENYFWSNGVTRPMSIELMKSAIKNAFDQIISSKATYKREAIVTMSNSMRLFLNAVAAIFHESAEHCGSVDAAASVIRVGMKKMEFPIWCIKSILDREETLTDKVLIAEVIDKLIGIANIKNYPGKATESDLATEIGEKLENHPELAQDLEKLITSQNCRSGMLAYLSSYRNGILCTLAGEIKDAGAYIAEVKKKFNADEANWVWSADTANVKIDEVIAEYMIISESNTVIAPASSLTGCVRNWKDRLRSFRISYDAMESELGDLKELMGLLCAIKRSSDYSIPEMKKARFLQLLTEQKSDFVALYKNQEQMFRKIAAGWISDLSDEDISELFSIDRGYLESDVYAETSEKYFKMVEKAVERFKKEQIKARLEKYWREKTKTNNPRDWSAKYITPILCMFSDEERTGAKVMFDIMLRQNINPTDGEAVMRFLEGGDFYERIASAQERDQRMRECLIGDYAYLLPDVDAVREYLSDNAAMIHPYDWMDNSVIRHKIEQMADKIYKTGGAAKAQSAVDSLQPDELREYLKQLIKSDMKVGIAIIKNKH